jgi:hypothetical protein
MDLDRYEDYPRARGPFAPWLLATLIGVVLGVAAIAAALTTDTRDFAARHQGVHAGQAL